MGSSSAGPGRYERLMKLLHGAILGVFGVIAKKVMRTAGFVLAVVPNTCPPSKYNCALRPCAARLASCSVCSRPRAEIFPDARIRPRSGWSLIPTSSLPTSFVQYRMRRFFLCRLLLQHVGFLWTSTVRPIQVVALLTTVPGYLDWVSAEVVRL
jgi:hypothetical protein